jgi:hypothetical protein
MCQGLEPAPVRYRDRLLGTLGGGWTEEFHWQKWHVGSRSTRICCSVGGVQDRGGSSSSGQPESRKRGNFHRLGKSAVKLSIPQGSHFHFSGEE